MWALVFMVLTPFLSYALSLESALELAVGRSYVLKALEAEKLALEGKLLTHRESLNPSFAFSLGNLGTSKESFSRSPLYNISYSQPLPYPEMFNKARQVRAFELKSLEERMQVERARLMGEVYRAFFTALYYKELLSLMQEELKLQEELKTFVERSFRLGEASRLELLRAERDYFLLLSELELIRPLYHTALKELSALAGEEVKEIEGSLRTLRPFVPLEVEALPHIRQYERALEVVNRSLELENILARPRVRLELLTEKVSDREYGVRVGLSSDLPLFYARQGEKLMLISHRETLTATKSAQLLDIRSKLDGIKARYSELERQLKALEDSIIPKAQEELNLALKSYRLRVIGLLEFSEVRRSYYGLLKKRLELLKNLHEEFAKYVVLGGGL
ncbi:MAG: TolC family protein [Aquificaceae bacterium]|nr:TolC family protein [Aquificaceae bacterium]